MNKEYIDTVKNSLRAYMKNKIYNLDRNFKKNLDSKILENILKFKNFQKAKRICIFRYDRRINTDLFIRKFIDLGKLVYFVQYDKHSILKFYKINNLKMLSFSNNQIKKMNEYKTINKIDLICINCLVFDKKGFIVGFGCGDRDRFLSKHLSFREKEVLLAYHFQRVKSVPINRFDIPINTIITDKGIFE